MTVPFGLLGFLGLFGLVWYLSFKPNAAKPPDNRRPYHRQSFRWLGEAILSFFWLIAMLALVDAGFDNLRLDLRF
ncbi:hypothetical protein [Photobacterium ganghwense]|uniref:hypothetical protein n=1 Tax=Photobacterium ganghwense TaxID=320778 RepID=UPI001A8DA32A|nr:hypothetical protein [Photobacterium ganghwense]QSV16523.1 hypothetical protein FH974_16120 [Photobacterium ganghwense]